MNEENNNENEGLGEGSDLDKLFNLLRQAREEFFNMDDPNNLTPIDNNLVDKLSELSIEPDRIEKHVENGVEFIVNHWYVPQEGDGPNTVSTIEVNGSDEDLMNIDVEEVINKLMKSELNKNQKVSIGSHPEITKKTLTERLEDAVAKEDYDLAAVLRDEIKSTKERISELIQRFNKTLESGNKVLGDVLLDEIRVLKNEI
jgi:hypothetical protein